MKKENRNTIIIFWMLCASVITFQLVLYFYFSSRNWTCFTTVIIASIIIVFLAICFAKSLIEIDSIEMRLSRASKRFDNKLNLLKKREAAYVKSKKTNISE